MEHVGGFQRTFCDGQVTQIVLKCGLLLALREGCRGENAEVNYDVVRSLCVLTFRETAVPSFLRMQSLGAEYA